MPLKKKLRLPLFWTNLLIDLCSAPIFLGLASCADELTVIGLEGAAALGILAAVAAVVVAFLVAVGFLKRPFGLTCHEYLWKRDW